MSRRERLRAETLAEIKATARSQMAESGTAAISLNAIARAMDMSGPNVYRYFHSRDDLVTALIVDAYDDLADTLEAAPEGLPPASYGLRLMAVLMAYREWALAHPVDFQLIYGNPIPGYRAPGEATTPPARRGFAVILRILAKAQRAGRLRIPLDQRALPQGLAAGLPPTGEGSADQTPAELVYLGVVGWARLHGILMLELFGHTSAIISDHGKFYRHEMENLCREAGLLPAPPDRAHGGRPLKTHAGQPALRGDI